jgi:signal transduction histidine kinase
VHGQRQYAHDKISSDILRTSDRLPRHASFESVIRILAVEDVAADLTLAERALTHAGLRCTIERVETAHDFRRGLESGPDLILCDFKLFQFGGLAALEIANTHTPNIPFIFLSRAIGEELAIEALKSGAADYVLKSNLARLVPAVARALKDRDERRIARQAEGRPSDAVAREREHLAYELHDGVCQQLAGISFLLAPLISPVAQLDPGVAQELEHIAILLAETIQTARTLAHDRAGGTEQESSDLPGALQEHAARLQAAHGVTIKVDATALSSHRLGANAVSEIAKLAREAMSNAIRHGGARSIIVQLKDADHDWQLEISDDGVGLPGDFTTHGGLGLRSMHHRAARLAGTFEIERLAPRGTCLRVSWPKRSEN